MTKLAITVTKQEIEAAILYFVNDKLTFNGRSELEEPLVSFSNSDGDIGYFTCLIEKDDYPVS